jgi:peptide/nickel transport system substrate-binding protein
MGTERSPGGPMPSASIVDPVTRLNRLALVLAALMTACSPAVSGPDVPRPTESVPTTTTSTVATTTTTPPEVAFESVVARPECPTSFCVVYHIEADAEWSDGTPVTAADFAYTASLLDPAAVVAVEEIDAKTAKVVFAEPYGPWPTLFERLYRNGVPAGALQEVDTTGPFTFAEWAEGEYLRLERDSDWWSDADPISGDAIGDVQRITFVFMESDEEMIEALAEGEVDVISSRPEAGMVERLSEMEDVDHAIIAGPYWEHIDFNHSDPILSQPWAREAVSLAIDRVEVLDRTVRLLSPGSEPLDNTVWMNGTINYEPHFEDEFDPGKAEEILADRGCLRGEDGIQICDGSRLSFVWASTDDDPAREAIFETVREDLEAVGIEIVGEFRSPSDFLTRDFLFGGPEEWQMINFSWRARPDPAAANGTYYCEDADSLNVNRYCSEDVERIIRETETVVDQEVRAARYNDADRLYLGEKPLIPLYQKPSLMAWTNEIDGPQPNSTWSGDLWNVASWSGKEEIVVALPSEPLEIDPTSHVDDTANTILGALLYGASGMDPSHARHPVLVDRFELIAGPSR